jgi:hypothetical protein
VASEYSVSMVRTLYGWKHGYNNPYRELVIWGWRKWVSLSNWDGSVDTSNGGI